ncbi:hypothetical protein KGF56_002854 [Candida oxycetoniae]|uniref:Uncharacterized protein n=1 Tax=Candida oxycetoniae TaxID=497107 RepID=A0AAI9WXT7_9ASCO|nr:uncharacterized protein KGF56_002854 [Candida oxycetoniae]KAI3404334.1 hypothetical protein KGF56_002854 [Candida oxycetoniae]
MHPSIIRLVGISKATASRTTPFGFRTFASTAAKNTHSYQIVPQYKYYFKRVPDIAMWFTGIAFFFGWPHVWVFCSNALNNAPGNRGQFY